MTERDRTAAVPATGSLERVVDEIREQVQRENGARQPSAGASPLVPYDVTPTILTDLETVREGWKVDDVDFPSSRRVIAQPIRAVKRLLRRFLTPILSKQARFNRAVSRLLLELRERNDILAHHQAFEREDLATAQDRLLQIVSERLTGLAGALPALAARIGALEERIARLEAAAATRAGTSTEPEGRSGGSTG